MIGARPHSKLNIVEEDHKYPHWKFICGDGSAILVAPTFSSLIPEEVRTLLKGESSYHDAIVSIVSRLNPEDDRAYTNSYLDEALPTYSDYLKSYVSSIGIDHFSSVRFCWGCSTLLPIWEYSKVRLSSINGICKNCEGRHICLSCGKIGRVSKEDTMDIDTDAKKCTTVLCPGCSSFYCGKECMEKDEEHHKSFCNGKNDEKNKKSIYKVRCSLIGRLGGLCKCSEDILENEKLDVISVARNPYGYVGCVKCCLLHMNLLGMVPSGKDRKDTEIMEEATKLTIMKRRL